MASSKVSINKVLFALLKVLVAVVSIWFIYSRITQRENFETFLAFVQQKFSEGDALPAMLGVAVLVFINYGLEAFKWKQLISNLEPLSLLKSMQAVFLGTTISFFTPNRVGEFAGRILFLKSQVRIQAVLSTFVGSLSQLLVTIVFGLLSASLMAKYFFDLSSAMQAFLVPASTVLIVLLLLLYPRINHLFSLPLLASLRLRFRDYLIAFESYTKRELWNVFLLSLLRYFIFTGQYILLLQFCDVSVQGWVMVALISIIFLIQSVVPTIAFAELAFRGSLAVLVFQKFTDNITGIVAASFGLWFFNLALPAIIGSVMFLYLKWKNKNIQA